MVWSLSCRRPTETGWCDDPPVNGFPRQNPDRARFPRHRIDAIRPSRRRPMSARVATELDLKRLQRADRTSSRKLSEKDGEYTSASRPVHFGLAPEEIFARRNPVVGRRNCLRRSPPTALRNLRTLAPFIIVVVQDATAHLHATQRLAHRATLWPRGSGTAISRRRLRRRLHRLLHRKLRPRAIQRM